MRRVPRQHRAYRLRRHRGADPINAQAALGSNSRFLRFGKRDPPHTWQRTARSERLPMIESHPSRPVGEVRRVLVLLCVSVPTFMIGIDSNIVAVSLPSIAHSLRADFSTIEWVISAYTLTFASLLLPAGALADRYGRKQMLVLGLTVFSFASFLCGATPNFLVLNAARALQGVGAALQLSAALAILSHQFHGPIRTRAFA